MTTATLSSLGFVPTMGALHAGHLSLVEAARRRNRHVAVSIFVNPTQFGPHEDFSRYPRPIEKDLQLCEAAGVDLVFLPSVEDMYPAGAPPMRIDLPAQMTPLEGAYRPGHFSGVCQIVAKLFNIVQPAAAYFGEKDFQQLAVIRAMVRAMDMPIEVVGCPTLRDNDGLAMSSRNQYLTPTQRQRGLSISHALFEAQRAVANGEANAQLIRDRMIAILNDATLAPDVPTHLDYAAIVDPDSLVEIACIKREARALVAMKVGTTRLIDNVALLPPTTTQH